MTTNEQALRDVLTGVLESRQTYVAAGRAIVPLDVDWTVNRFLEVLTNQVELDARQKNDKPTAALEAAHTLLGHQECGLRLQPEDVRPVWDLVRDALAAN